MTTGQGTTPVPSTAVGTTRGWAAHRPLMDGTTPAGTPTGTASRPALRRWPVVPAGASVPTHTSQGQDEAGGTSQDGARHEAPARTQQERGRSTADTEPTAQHGTGRRTGCARAAPSARTSRQACEQRCHRSHITTMPSNCTRGDGGLPSTTAASQTVADPAACWCCPECYTPTDQAPRFGTDARREPRRRPPRAMPLNARHRTTPQAHAIHRGADAEVDVVRGSRRAAGRADLRRLLAGSQPPAAQGRGLRADDLGSASDCRPPVVSLPAEHLSR